MLIIFEFLVFLTECNINHHILYDTAFCSFDILMTILQINFLENKTVESQTFYSNHLTI